MTRPTCPCADIGGSFITFGQVDDANLVHGVRRVPTPGASWPAFVASLRDLLDDDATPFCIAVAGLVDPLSGVVTSANIACLNGRVLAADLSAALGRPVALANDADCFTLAEATAGAAKPGRVVFGAILGTGVGGGLVIDGRLVRGAGGVTGEWGHGPMAGSARLAAAIDLATLRCGCGRVGCLDTVGGARGVERLHLLLGGAPSDSHAIVAGWIDGQPEPMRTMALYLDTLADQLALVLNVTGADIVPVGGGLGSVAPVVAALDAAVRARLMRSAPMPVVVPGMLGERAGLIGAAALSRRARVA